ncbi:hypothetical protein [Sphingomonas sp. KR3-1]|uniref:hypothetical protein n=1 Tax=Sphingomonas sp. KR3-1 TaxID=3156611 RepID=UPI0032B381E4
MRKLLSFAMVSAAPLFCLWVQPAFACRTAIQTAYVFLNEAPAFVPEGQVLLRVKVDIGDGAWKPVTAQVLEPGRRRWKFDTVIIDPGMRSSCSQWGESKRVVYVVGALQLDEKGVYTLRATQMVKRGMWVDQ